MTEKLALDGGRPSVPEHLGTHDWERYRKAGEEEIDAVVEVLRSGHLSIAWPVGMPQADALEQEFADWVGANYSVVVNSGTAALHCAVAGVGIEAGDHVLVPAETFIASAMAVLHHNAIPIFVDVDARTHLIDPAKIEEKITERTKAIMVVHLHGLPGDMDEINEIARRHDLKVIEDAAQCYGGLYNGKKTGTLGDAAGFAMTTTKQLMVGEGGLLTTNSKEIYERATMTRLFGETPDMKAPDRAYKSKAIGWNYKLSEVNSALARVRLRGLDEYIGACQERAEYLTGRLQSIEGLTTPVLPSKRTHTYYMYSVQVDPTHLGLDIEAGKLRDAVMKALAAENVDVARWQKIPVPAQPMFQNKLAYGNGSPWNIPGGDVSYDIDDYPNAFAALEQSFVVRRLVPPNGFDLMDSYADAFEKVFSQIDRVVEIFDQTATYVPLEDRRSRLATGEI